MVYWRRSLIAHEIPVSGLEGWDCAERGLFQRYPVLTCLPNRSRNKNKIGSRSTHFAGAEYPGEKAVRPTQED